MSWTTATILLLGFLLLATGALLIRTLFAQRKLRRELGSAYDHTEQLQHSFNRFAPWQLVDELADARKVPEASEREITVLFVDIRDFTGVCETLSPTATIELLNRYYTAVTAGVSENRGHTLKYIGDGVLAVFGALDNNPWHADDAVHAALAIAEKINCANLSEISGFDGKVRLSMGVHTGPVVAGVTGSGELLEFTVLGTTVNIAARIEELTRNLDATILVTEETQQKLDPRFIMKEHPRQHIKGISVPVGVFSIEGYDRAGPQRSP